MKSEPNSAAELAAQLTKATDTVNIDKFAGGLPQEKAILSQLRIGSRWFSTAQILTLLIPLGFVGMLVMISEAQQLRTIPNRAPI